MSQNRYPQKTPAEYRMEEEYLAQNGTRRVPIVVCVDCSYSMRQNQRLQKVMEGLHAFRQEMENDRIACDTVELCLVQFSGEAARVVCDFATPDVLQLPDTLATEGETPLADAVNLALEMIEQRKARYADYGISYYRPWMVIIGDGDETRSDRQLQETARRLRAEYDAKHLNVLCVIVGDDSQVRNESSSLRSLSPDGKVHFLRDLKFCEFFGWFSRSIHKASMSMSGEELLYEPTGDWAEILG